MGYTTEYEGTLKFSKPMTKELKEYINTFADRRHMVRNTEQIKEEHPQWKELCYNGNLGPEGEYFIGGRGFLGQDSKDASIVDYNQPPKNCPGLWCKWMINNADELEWDGREKFYNDTEWLEYLIKNFFAPEGYILNGEIEYQGEEPSDNGVIVVTNNIVERN